MTTLGMPEVSSQSSSSPLRLALVWDFSSLLFLLLLSSLWPPRPLESKVIQIQSDHLLAASPPVAAMEPSLKEGNQMCHEC